MTKLYICEKGSLAKDIAMALDPSAKKAGPYHWNVKGGHVFELQGHVFELYEPQEYDPDFKRWRWQSLPIVPTAYRYSMKAEHKARVAALKTLVKDATEIISCGDPDTEGSGLVYEAIEAVRWTRGYKRAWWLAQTPDNLRKALDNLKPQSFDKPYVDAQRARAHSDWLLGMNGTRAASLALLGKVCAAIGPEMASKVKALNTGRVLTPVLALLVQREKDIRSFKSKDFFEMFIDAQHAGGKFKAKWVPGPQLLDAQDQATDKAAVAAVVKKVEGKTGKVVAFSSTTKKGAAPLPHSLTSLMGKAGSFGLSLQQLEDATQALYDTHKLGSYPRTEVRFISMEGFKDAKDVIDAIAANDPSLAALCRKANLKIKHKAFDDSKCGSHTALQPTAMRKSVSSLNPAERKVYRVYCQTFLALFFEPKEWQALSVELEIEGEKFRATGQVPLKPGYLEVFGKEIEDDDDDEEPPLPAMAKGDAVKANKAELAAKATKAPPFFTEATLLIAMAEISKFVTNPKVRELLTKDPDDPASLGGLGTPATRKECIKKLKTVGFAQQVKTHFRPTALGEALIDALPAFLKSPDLTAQLEHELRGIKHGTNTYEAFMARQQALITKVVTDLRASQKAYEGDHKCPLCKKGDLTLITGKSAGKLFWKCSESSWDAKTKTASGCTAFYWDKSGSPDLSTPQKGK